MPPKSAATRALIGGLGDVLRAPALIITSVAAMIVIALPFGATVGARVRLSLAHRQPVGQPATEIDAGWWQEFLDTADGISATFTPAIIGFAAPLDNLSALLDGTARPLIVMVPIAIAVVVWAFIWGAALNRFAFGRDGAGIWRAGARMLPQYTAISVLAAALVMLLYATAHPLLFDVIGKRMEMSVTREPTAFVARVVLYAIFGFLLVAIGVVADYARIRLALSAGVATPTAIAGSWRFVRAHAAPVFGLYLAGGLLFVLLLAAYGAVEVVGGVDVGGWRGVVIAQVYIILRIAIRLSVAASELRLYRALTHVHGASAAGEVR